MKPLTLVEVVQALGARHEPADRDLPVCSVRGVSTDSRTVGPGELFFALRGERFDGHAFVGAAMQSGATAAVVSNNYTRPVDLTEKALLLHVPDTLAALGRLGRFHRKLLSATVIAVTGSNGKTTTKAMIDQVLSGWLQGRSSIKSYNNAIGVPLTLLAAEASDDFLVVEVGSNTPGEIDALARLIEPDIAVITSVSAAHLERLGDVAGVAKEKTSLLRRLPRTGTAILPEEPAVLFEQLPRRPNHPDSFRVVTFGTGSGVDLRLTDFCSDADGMNFEVNDRFVYRLNVPGRHNVTNALAAIAVARRLGLDHGEIAARLMELTLPAMRLERWRIGQIEIINDAYNANPASMAAAVETLRSTPCDGRRIAVLGHMRELGAMSDALHEEVGRAAARAGIDVLVAVGENGERMTEAARRTLHEPMAAYACSDTDDAAERLARMLRPGDLVLVKASRAEALERIIETLAALMGEPAACVAA